jgi:hypothetical protein
MTGNGADPEVRAGGQTDPLAILQRIRQTTRRAPAEGEQCEMCGEAIPEQHSHVVNLDGRNLLCACRACYLLFAPEGAGGGRYRAVPERYLIIDGFELSPAEWDRLQIPVGVAFFFHNSAMGVVAAFYPSPAGATESLLPLDAWEGIAEANPIVKSLEPDVEALLIRTDRARTECFVVPIDACYELVGLLRMKWKGFDGGQEAHDEIGSFFSRLRERSREASAVGDS